MAKRRRRKKTESESGVSYPRKSCPYTTEAGCPLDLLRKGELTVSPVIVWYSLERNSGWDTGITHRRTAAELAAQCRISVREVYRSLEVLKEKGLLRQRTPKGSNGHVYELWPFEPKAREARATNAQPRENGPLDYLAKGEIDRYAVISFFQWNIGWHLRDGETLPMSMSLWEKMIGISRAKLYDCKAQLKRVGLLVQTSVKTFASKFRLFPFLKPSSPPSPSPSPSPVREPEPVPVLDPLEVMEINGIYHHDGNKYRHGTLGYEQYRPSRVLGTPGSWAFIADRLPPAVLRYIEQEA